MQKLIQPLLTARWKSYKTFRHSGEVRLHTPTFFKEIHLAPDGVLSVKAYRDGNAKTLLQTDQWKLEFKNNGHYLVLPQENVAYEIITVNHTVLVLRDNTTWEKTFYTKEMLWQDYLQSNGTVTM